jgi:hypothetical protein
MKFVLSKFKVSLLAKPVVQVSKYIINGILRVVTIRIINSNASIISEEYRLGLRIDYLG